MPLLANSAGRSSS